MWLSPPKTINLPANEVHVWRINLDRTEFELDNLFPALSTDERTRAERFHFEQHRQRFIASRGILRSILGRYLDIPPVAVQFDYESRGKPFLADKNKNISFNLSHSQDLGLCAVGHNQYIGADLEWVRPMDDVEALTKRFFLPAEYEVMRSLPPQEQLACFFRYWTCKEAYLKALGAGLAKLEQAGVSLTPTTAASLQTNEEWSLIELVPADKYVAAIAVEGIGWELRYWQY
jgi:4'-phosphopantetheinyl transferase